MKRFFTSSLTRTIVAVLCVAFFVAPFLLISPLEKKQGYGKVDFAVFYAAGKVVLSQTHLHAPDVYVKSKFRPLVKSIRVQSGGTKFLYPPQATLLFAPFALLTLKGANTLWLWGNVLLFVATYYAVIRFLIRDSWTKYRYSIFLVLLSFADPVQGLFRTGQVNGLIFALLVGACILMQKKSLWSGVLIGVAASIKIFPLFFVLPLIVRKQWKALAAFCVSVGTLWLATVPSFGWKGLLRFYDYPLKDLLAGKINDVAQSPSLYGTFVKLVRDDFFAFLPIRSGALTHIIGYIITFMLLGGLAYIGYVIHKKQLREVVVYGLLITLILLCSKSIQTQYFLWLVPLALFWLSTWNTQKIWSLIYQVIALYCIFFWSLIPTLHTLFYKRLNLVGLLCVAAWIVWHLYTKKSPSDTTEVHTTE